MRLAYLQCFSGISGDMFLGALVDAGVAPEALHDTVKALNIGAGLEITRVVRSGIAATKVDVWVNGEKDLPREKYWEQRDHVKAASSTHSAGHEHRHENRHDIGDHAHGLTRHDREHSAAQSHEHSSGEHVHSHGHSRGLTEIRTVINAAAISHNAKKKAIEIFEALGKAESKIHDTPIEEIHFHEVGAVDAMVDIVCAAVGAELLGVDAIICSPLNVGGGSVNCAHGMFPVPAPATVELLAGAPVYSSGIQAELVTPTGAAIVKVMASRFADLPKMTISKTGYGAGSRDLAGTPNVLRLIVGEIAEEETAADKVNRISEMISVLEANIDDLNPQVFGYVMERLLNEGALDVFGMPVQMKKNRPGMLLTVLCKPEDAAKLTELIFTETSTLGIRRRQEMRSALARRWVEASTPWGEIRIKIASMNGSITNYAPEYEDCRRVAAEHHVPLKQVIQEAIRSYLASNVAADAAL